MAVIQAFRQAPDALVRAPALVVPPLILFLLQAPTLVLQSTNPMLASTVSTMAAGFLLLVVPFYMGGMVGMADEALDGQSTLRAFLAHGKANFVQILVAYLLLMVLYVVVGGILFVVGFGALLAVVFQGGTLVLVGFGLVAVLIVFVYLLTVFLIQFYAQAIVLEERTAIDALRRSYRVVRSNLLAALGYTGVASGLGAVLGTVIGVLSLLTTPEAAAIYGLPVLSTGELIGFWLVATLVGSAISAFLLVYSVSFFRLVTR